VAGFAPAVCYLTSVVSVSRVGHLSGDTQPRITPTVIEESNLCTLFSQVAWKKKAHSATYREEKPAAKMRAVAFKFNDAKASTGLRRSLAA
jgi:hypothetical protein